MLYSTVTPSAKRAALRRRLSGSSIIRLPGTFTPLSSRVIERQGFEGVYISGAVMANELALPDIGLTTMTEVASRGAQIARATDLPAIIDGDTGFGEPMNVARTVQAMEDAGLTGVHFEDQVNPKRCGHLDGKEVVDDATAISRIRAAVTARRDPDFLIIARTDVHGAQGMAGTLRRAQLLEAAGADVIFAEALADLSEFERMREAVEVPLLANMTEFGRSDLYTVKQLESVGVDMVIFPVSLLRVAMGAMGRALEVLDREGTLETEVPSMLNRKALYELVSYEEYATFDEGIFTFDLSNNRS